METLKKSNRKQITLNMKENYNNKLYGRYWAEIFEEDKQLYKDTVLELKLKDVIIGSVKAVHIEAIKYHEIPSFQMSLITGMNHADSLEYHYGMGYNVKDFDLRVKLVFFETIAYAPKKR